MAKNSGYLGSVVVTPTISTSAYADGDQVGGLMTLTLPAKTIGKWDGVLLGSIKITDQDGQNAPLDFLFYNASVTLQSDNAAASLSAADIVKHVGNKSVTADDYAAVSAMSVATKEVVIPMKPLDGSTDAVIYASIISRGTPTYTDTDHLQVTFDFYGEIS